MKIPLLIFVSIALSACGGIGKSDSSNDEARGPYPTNWKSIVANYIQQSYLDPNSVINSEASAPFQTRDTFLHASWTVCIRNNAKNQFGGYTGLRTTEINISNGKVIAVRPENQFSCPNVKFEPFPLK